MKYTISRRRLLSLFRAKAEKTTGKNAEKSGRIIFCEQFDYNTAAFPAIHKFFFYSGPGCVIITGQRRDVSTVPRQTGVKEISSNRKAFHEYFVLERYEAGIELFGTEVKSIRAGQVNLKDSFCTVKDGELFVRGMHISPYEHGNIFNKDPVRPRRLLMHKREIMKLQARIMQDGVALIPLSLYFKDSRVKLELGLCKGKKLHDKRDSEADRQSKRDIDRIMKERNYQ